MNRTLPFFRNTLLGALSLIFGFANGLAKEIRVPSARILTIQQGVDAAAPGDTILVSPGTYSSASISSSKPGLKLKAAGPPGAVKIVSGPGLAGIYTEADDTSVEGFDVSGGTIGIVAQRSKQVIIAGNTVHDCSVAGINVDRCAGGEVRGNTAGTGSPVAEGIGLFACSGVHVHHNDSSGAPGSGILIQGSADCEVDHNTLRGNGSFGIFLIGSSDGSNRHHHLHHNQADDNAEVGITLFRTPDCILNHNETDNNRGEGIGVKLNASPNCALEHNHANRNGMFGIALFESPNSAVDNNEASDNGMLGILAWDSCGSTFDNNSTLGNASFDLYDANGWDESGPNNNSFQHNHAVTAFPSLAWWDAK